jgi:hypothetical protein
MIVLINPLIYLLAQEVESFTHFKSTPFVKRLPPRQNIFFPFNQGSAKFQHKYIQNDW